MALGSTQPLTEMSKGGQCVGLTTFTPSCVDCLEIWEPQPPGTLEACPGLYRVSLGFTHCHVPTVFVAVYVSVT
jgi:hypothetical protein